MLPEIISKEPLGPAVRQGDDQWFDIVRWTHYAMLNAEELGVTKANVDEMLKIRQPRDQAPARHRGRVRRGASASPTTGPTASSSTSATTARVFERNVGQGSPLKIARGLNALWTKGGLQYAPPIR